MLCFSECTRVLAGQPWKYWQESLWDQLQFHSQGRLSRSLLLLYKVILLSLQNSHHVVLITLSTLRILNGLVHSLIWNIPYTGL